jgi:Radical SAM superfamily
MGQNMSRVLLSNPPAPRPTMRDYYCSSTSKAGYAWQPIDLLVQGAWLRERHDLIWRDFAVTPAKREQALATIAADRPDVIVGLVGAAAPGDWDFWREAQEATGARLVVSGDLARFAAAETLAAEPHLEGVLVDFTRPAVARLLAGEEPGPGLLTRNGPPPPDDGGDFAYPVPPHELAWALDYRHPFLPAGFATVMTDHGCPHHCRYCNSGAFGWRPRALDSLEAELAWLAARGRRALFIKDMTFNASRERTMRVLKLLRRTGPWQFVCYVRPDKLDADLAVELAYAGCVMAMAGLESGDEELLAQVRPTATLEAARRGVLNLHRAGVPVGGHFLLGLPGETESQIARTVALARRLPLAYASFNLATPRVGTPFYVAGQGVADGSSAQTRLVAGALDRETLLDWRHTAIRAFYARPSYLVRQAWRGLRSGLLWRQARHGWRLVGVRSRG